MECKKKEGHSDAQQSKVESMVCFGGDSTLIEDLNNWIKSLYNPRKTQIVNADFFVRLEDYLPSKMKKEIQSCMQTCLTNLSLIQLKRLPLYFQDQDNLFDYDKIYLVPGDIFKKLKKKVNPKEFSEFRLWEKSFYPSEELEEGNWDQKKEITGQVLFINQDEIQVFPAVYDTEISHNIYKGSIVKGQREGHGMMIFKDRSVYDGEWKNNKREGFGVMSSKDKSKYEGKWANDKRNGQGKQEYANADLYEGNWVDGFRSGYGVMTYSNGCRYEG